MFCNPAPVGRLRRQRCTCVFQGVPVTFEPPLPLCPLRTLSNTAQVQKSLWGCSPRPGRRSAILRRGLFRGSTDTTVSRVYLQAKRYKLDSPVSEPEIRAFSGSLGAAKASKGVFVTTSYFTRPALHFAERHPFKMVLIDGTQLAALMIRHNVGVRTAETLHVKKLDEDFFAEE